MTVVYCVMDTGVVAGSVVGVVDTVGAVVAVIISVVVGS